MSVITDCPYICAPNIMDTPDYTTKMVTLDMAGGTVVKAGTPISADGKVANDETAIGILLNDCHACLGNRRGLVVISGRIKQDVAAEHSGVTISDEAKSAMINVTFTGDTVRAGGGGTTWADLGEPVDFEINWDGSTEGREVISQPMSDESTLNYYKVSDEYLTAEQLTGAVMTVSGVADSAFSSYLPETYTITAENVTTGDGYVVVTAQYIPLVASAQEGTELGCSQGVYVLLAEAEVASQLLGTTVESDVVVMKIKKAGIRTIPAEYLPEPHYVEKNADWAVSVQSAFPSDSLGCRDVLLLCPDLVVGKSYDFVITPTGTKTSAGTTYTAAEPTTVSVICQDENGSFHFSFGADGVPLLTKDDGTIVYVLTSLTLYPGGTARICYTSRNGWGYNSINGNWGSFTIKANFPNERQAFESFDLWSSTEGSTKLFRITVDDSGTLGATEITK